MNDFFQNQSNNKDLSHYEHRMYVKGDIVIQYFSLGSLAFAIILTLVRVGTDWLNVTWLILYALGIFPFLSFSAARFFSQGTLFTRMMAAWLLSSYGFMFIAVLEGTTSKIAFLFITPVILIFYKDWKPYIPIFIFSALYNILFTKLIFVYGFEWAILLKSEGLEIIPTLHYVIKYIVATFNLFTCVFLALYMRKHYFIEKNNKILAEQRKKTLQKNLNFAEKIERGELDIHFNEGNNQEQLDELGQALIKIRDSTLRNRQIAEQSNFKTKGLAILGEVFREYSQDIDLLSQEILNALTGVLHAQQGILFLKNPTTNKLEHWASYAHVDKFLDTINWENSLVEQSLKSNKLIHLKKIPADYTPIHSASGSSFDSEIILFPLRNGLHVIGVVELLSFTAYQAHEVEFANTISEIIGSVIDSVQHDD